MCKRVLAPFWCIAVFVLRALLGIRELPQEAIVKDGVEGIGIVVRTIPHEHRTIEYAYVVEGQRYSSREVSFATDAVYEQLVPGDTVKIRYSASRPELSTSDDPMEALRDAVRNRWMSALVFGTMASGFMWSLFCVRTVNRSGSTGGSVS